MNTQYFFVKRAATAEADRTITFTLRTPSGTDSDTLYDGAAPADTECFVFLDGAYDDDADAAPTRVQDTGTNVSLFKMVLSADQTTANYIDIIISDGGSSYRDAHLKIFTEINLGNVDIDASAGSNLTALKLTGQGTGHGLEAIGGATGQDINGVLGEHVLRNGTAQAGAASTITLDASASGTNDYYNGAIILVTGGTGAAQSRVITDYVGSTKVATVNKSWATNQDSDSTFVIVPGPDSWAISPGAELSAMPTYASNYADMLQFLYERFAYKRTMSTTDFQMYNAAGDTAKFESTSNTDVGGTQTFNEMADV